MSGAEKVCPDCGCDMVAKCPEDGCDANVEVYSRIVGYLRPTSTWNPGKKQEFKERETFAIRKIKDHQMGE